MYLPEPVCAGRDRRSSGTSAHGVDLRRVDPRELKDGECEEDDEEVQADGCTLAVLLLVWAQQACPCDDERTPLANGTDQKESATANALDEEE